MDLKETEHAIEAILFAAAEPVEISLIAGAVGLSEEDAAVVLDKMAERYISEGRGIRIIRLGETYQMCTSEEYYPHVSAVLGPKMRQGLSQAALETLAIIAYNQPVTKSSIEYIRGVDCTYSISKLIEKGLIEEAGRLDAPGRPVLYVTTTKFLRCFGLSSLEELPRIDTDNASEIAENEE